MSDFALLIIVIAVAVAGSVVASLLWEKYKPTPPVIIKPEPEISPLVKKLVKYITDHPDDVVDGSKDETYLSILGKSDCKPKTLLYIEIGNITLISDWNESYCYHTIKLYNGSKLVYLPVKSNGEALEIGNSMYVILDSKEKELHKLNQEEILGELELELSK